jgi:parallel beta-helix repeat protein
VGQSQNIRVVGNEAYSNVAGIEIENSHNAIVENNKVHDNSAGVLVFALPGAFRFVDNNGVLVRGNTVVGNNRPIADTAAGIVRGVPPGTGVMAMAAQNTEVTGNTITSQKTAGVLVVSFQSTGLFFDPTTYDPYVRAFYAHDNTISDFGSQPDGVFADPAGLASLVDGLFASLAADGLPQRMPAVVWDGLVDPATGTTGAQGEGGDYSGNLQICSRDNTIDIPIIAGQISYEDIDFDLLALEQGLSSGPVFPFPPRMDCQITLPAVTGLP